MVLSPFLTCLSENDVLTGASVLGIYTFNSGDSNIIFNELYPTGSNYSGSYINSNNLPLISVGSSMPVSGNFTGTNCLRVGYETLGNFSMIFTLNYNGCQKLNLRDYTILSSYPSSGSGINYHLSINDANRIFFQSSGAASCVSEELVGNNFVYFSVIQNEFVEFGIFNYSQNTLYSNQLDMGVSGINSDILYIGSEFNPNNNSTGLFGTINDMILFDGSVSNNISDYISCWYVTGFASTSGLYSLAAQYLTGSYLSGTSGTLTSSSNITGLIQKENGSPIQVILTSGTSTGIITGFVATPLYGQTGINITTGGIAFAYNQNAINNFGIFSINFTEPLQSGDSLEIYTNPLPIYGVGLQPVGNLYPQVGNGFISLMDNGVWEGQGISYTVVRNQISGFDPNDIVSYDVINSQSVTIFISGSGSGTSTTINVTGIGGVCTGNVNYPNFGWDVYLNGQKLLSGYQYNVGYTGINSFYVAISGSEIVDINNNTFNIEQSEITFIPQYLGFFEMYSGVTTITPQINNLTGFSEQVWCNGVRFCREIDYVINSMCSTISGQSDTTKLTFNFFNNNPYLVNFIYPPSINNLSTGLSQVSGNYHINSSWQSLNLNGYPSGTYINIYGQINNSGYNLLTGLDVLVTGFSWNVGSSILGNIYCIKGQYQAGNIYSSFSNILCN